MNYKLDLDSLLTPSIKILYDHSINEDKEFKMEDIKTALAHAPDVTVEYLVHMIGLRQTYLEQQPTTVEIKESEL